MSRHLKRRRYSIVLVVLLGLTLPTMAGAASHRATSEGSTGASPLAGSLWRLFAVIWTKAGCIIDPDGASGSGKEGCIIDPNGVTGSSSCTPSGRAKNGCIIDPNGAAGPACATPPQTTEEGCILDPDGSFGL